MLHTRFSGSGDTSIKTVSLLGFLGSLVIISTLAIVYLYSVNPMVSDDTRLWRSFLLLSFTIPILFTGIFLGRLSSAAASRREVKIYKEFTQHLHLAQTEEDAYAVLFDYLRAMPSNCHISLCYTNNLEEDSWTTLANRNESICTANPVECPLIKTGGSYHTGDLSKDLRCPMLSPSCTQGSCYCTNISGREYSKSLLLLYSPHKNAFNRSLISGIKSYVEVTRLLVNNRRCFHILNEKANTDKLTGLYNRYFLDYYLENQLEASMLSGQPLSLILTDIDDFKIINDTYGHQAGDILLAHFSGTVLGSLRKSDVMVRYGGDEFIIILPCTGVATARIISERIRNLVNISPIPDHEGIKLPQITCSLGISSFPDPAADATELIKQADKALYHAKNSGSNRTSVYGNGSFG